jgi:hypothetical protein
LSSRRHPLPDPAQHQGTKLPKLQCWCLFCCKSLYKKGLLYLREGLRFLISVFGPRPQGLCSVLSSTCCV